MKNELRASTIVLGTLLLATACAGQGQRVSESTTTEPPPAVPPPAAPAPPPTEMRSPSEGLAPIPGHPPVTMSGLLKGVDLKLATITFEDGRTVKLSKESEILEPIVVEKVGPGTPIDVRTAMQRGGWTKALAGS